MFTDGVGAFLGWCQWHQRVRKAHYSAMLRHSCPAAAYLTKKGKHRYTGPHATEGIRDIGHLCPVVLQ